VALLIGQSQQCGKNAASGDTAVLAQYAINVRKLL
jgi:hypothetical protein